MRYLSLAILLVSLAAATCGCVSAQRYENLQAERNELKQALETNRQMLDAAKKDYLSATATHEQYVSDLQQQLTDEKKKANILQDELGQMQKKYDEASKAASKVAQDNLALLDEKKKLNDTIIELKGTIATLGDTIKDLKTRLEEQTPKFQPPPPSSPPPESVPVQPKEPL